MTKLEQYAANALECRKMAQRAARADQKAGWMWLEQSWLAILQGQGGAQKPDFPAANLEMFPLGN
jgi:hypothetical protein